MPNPNARMNKIWISGFGMINTAAFDHQKANIITASVKNFVLQLPIGHGRINQLIMDHIIHMAILIIVHPAGLQHAKIKIGLAQCGRGTGHGVILLLSAKLFTTQS